MKTNSENILTQAESRTILAGVSPSMLYTGRFPRDTAKAIWYTLANDADHYDPDTIQAMKYAIIRSRVRRRCNKGITYVTNRWGKRIPKELHPECRSMDYQNDITNGIYVSMDAMFRFCYAAIDNMILAMDRQYFNKGTKYWTTRLWQYHVTTGWTEITLKQYYRLYNECPERDDISEEKIIVRNLSDTAEDAPSRTLADIPDYSQSKIHNILARLLAKGMSLSEIANRTGRNWRTIHRLAKELANATKIRDMYASLASTDYRRTQPDHIFNARYSSL